MLPVKGGPRAKSRLGASPALSLAIADDTLAAVLGCPLVDEVLVVSADEAVLRTIGSRPGVRPVIERLDDPGLLGAVRAGLAALADRTGPVAVLLADLPALRAQDLSSALQAAAASLTAGARTVAVPDAAAVGTVLLAAAGAHALDPAFGPSSLAAHRRRGAAVLVLDLPRLRRDVDTADDLRHALALGVGPHTRRALDAPAQGEFTRVGAYPEDMQATVHRFDPGEGTGALVDDAGAVLPFGADAFARSGLRHLRVGQRLTVETDGSGRVTALRLGRIGVLSDPGAAQAVERPTG